MCKVSKSNIVSMQKIKINLYIYIYIYVLTFNDIVRTVLVLKMISGNIKQGVCRWNPIGNSFKILNIKFITSNFWLLIRHFICMCILYSRIYSVCFSLLNLKSFLWIKYCFCSLCKNVWMWWELGFLQKPIDILISILF